MSYDPLLDGLSLNSAPRQLDRRLAALEEGYAKVDGRSFEELCTFVARFGELIWFYGSDNRHHGDWSDFFAADATIASTMMRELGLGDEQRFRQAVALAVSERDEDIQLAELRIAGGILVGLARQVDRWLEMLSRGAPREDSRSLRQRLRQSIEEELREPLATLAGYDAGAAPRDALGERLGLELEGFLPIWRLDDVPPDSSPYWGRARSAKIAHAAGRFEPLAEVLFAGAEGLRRVADVEVAASLEAADHRPQTALYLAFARLFRSAQDSINTFGRRYVDFYYRQVLRERQRGALADRLYLTYTLAGEQDIQQATVPEGTLFPAGKDAAGETILYRAERDLVVTPARLQRLRTLRLWRTEQGAPRRLLASEMRLADGSGGGEELGLPAWPTFGPDSETAGGSGALEVTRPATLGLALSSTCLRLAGGNRKIRLIFSYRWSDDPRVEPLVPGKLRRVLARAFELLLTSAEGWRPVPYGVELPTVPVESDGLVNGVELPTVPVEPDGPVQRGEFLIRVKQSKASPAIVPLPAGCGIPIPDVDPGAPALALRLRQGRNDPLRRLFGLLITGCEIKVEAESLTELGVENSEGEVDTSAPFLPFGGTPTVGAKLRIRHEELFIKRLKSLEVVLRWFGLPRHKNGFEGHYRDYVVDADGEDLKPRINNQSFQGKFWVAPRKPSKEEPCVDVYLFRAPRDSSSDVPDAEAVLDPSSRFKLSCQAFLARLLAPQRASARPADNRASRRALELELSAPTYAFGHDLFAHNVMAATLKRLDADSSCDADFFQEREAPWAGSGDVPAGEPRSQLGPRDDRLSYPNEPWLPRVESIEVGYEAAASADAESDAIRLSYLLPFGGCRRVEPGDDGAFPILPSIDAEGQLLLGWRGLEAPQVLALLVVMGPRDETQGQATPNVEWSYLDPRAPKSGWRKLTPEQVRRDGTAGLTRTGILELALPNFGAADGRIQPSDLHWIRAAVKDSAGSFPGTHQLIPQASTAVAVLAEGADACHLAEPLPAHTIDAAVEPLSGIATVVQPLASVDGRPAETRRDFETRLGERLRHKDRAMVPWDYQRLVLERFPTVWQVKVMPARDASWQPAPGHVTVMVVAAADGRPGVDPTAPMASSELLREIEIYLAERASPFVRVHAVNPRYVRIRVQAQVVFSDRYHGVSGITRLNHDLVDRLSPWFAGAEDARYEGDSITESKVADFVVTRSYVVWLESLKLVCEIPAELGNATADGHFFTSALRHDIQEAPELGPCAIEPLDTARRDRDTFR